LFFFVFIFLFIHFYQATLAVKAFLCPTEVEEHWGRNMIVETILFKGPIFDDLKLASTMNRQNAAQAASATIVRQINTVIFIFSIKLMLSSLIDYFDINCGGVIQVNFQPDVRRLLQAQCFFHGHKPNVNLSNLEPTRHFFDSLLIGSSRGFSIFDPSRGHQIVVVADQLFTVGDNPSESESLCKKTTKVI
jgi:hypothetical protein